MKSEQAMALIRAHFEADRAMFRSVALQIAADAASRHGGSLSKEIRRIVDASPADGLTPLPKTRDGETESLTVRNPHRLDDLILAPGILAAIRQFLDEQKYADKLVEHGCTPMCKILFDGPPGTGKTATAGAIAHTLGVPFLVAKQSELVSSFMGDSEKSTARIFDFLAQNRAVVLLDEFDGIGTARSGHGTAAEKSFNSLVTTILQSMDAHRGPGILIAATNLPDKLDAAIVRRFDLAVTFDLPTEEVRRELIRRTLGDEDGAFAGSHAVIVRDCLREKRRRLLEWIRDLES